MKSIYLLLLLCLSMGIISCNKDEVITKDVPLLPEITLDSENNTYSVKVGRTLTISPTVKNTENAFYEWTIDGVKISNELTLTRQWHEPGEVFIKFKVSNDYGISTEEIKVEVAELAPPVISLALPASGLKVLPGTDYIFTPDIQNADLDEFKCKWIRENNIVAEGISYTFNESELGTYTIVCHASNIDGETSREIQVEVVGQLPYKVRFEQQSYFSPSTDRYVFINTPIFLEAITEYLEAPIFNWSIDNNNIESQQSQLLKYTPIEAGEHIITVTVTEGNQPVMQLTRNIARALSSVTTTVKVVCVDAIQEERYRAATATSSPDWNKVYEYTPAPGQFIGELNTGGFNGTETTPEAAVSYAEKRLKAKSWVSLGAFGGYIVIGFDHSIPKRAQIEEKYDFTIQGNAFDGSSEPGIVWVMQDINKNGLPDDEWYELRGCETGLNTTIQNYAVTYYRPAGKQMSVQWTDSKKGSGSIDYLPSFHTQDYYYPKWVSEDTYTLRGTRLRQNNSQDPSTGFWDNKSYDWGYADNFGKDRLGGDTVDGSNQTNGFKISNAMYRDGTLVDLKFIDFIKVQTGVQVKSGWLGEVSTEVFCFKDLSIDQ